MEINGRIAMDLLTITHEYGHMFGFSHSANIRRKRKDDDLHDTPDSFHSLVEYGDRHTVMGNNYGFEDELDFAAHAKYGLGWLDGSKNKELGGSSGTYKVYAMDSGKTPKGLASLTMPFGSGYHSYNDDAPLPDHLEYMLEYKSRFTKKQVDADENGCVTVRLVRKDKGQSHTDYNFYIREKSKTIEYCNPTRERCLDLSGIQIPASSSGCLTEGQTFTDGTNALTMTIEKITKSYASIKVSDYEFKKIDFALPEQALSCPALDLFCTSKPGMTLGACMDETYSNNGNAFNYHVVKGQCCYQKCNNKPTFVTEPGLSPLWNMYALTSILDTQAKWRELTLKKHYEISCFHITPCAKAKSVSQCQAMTLQKGANAIDWSEGQCCMRRCESLSTYKKNINDRDYKEWKHFYYR
eukprot:Awhi_evm1s13751